MNDDMQKEDIICLLKLVLEDYHRVSAENLNLKQENKELSLRLGIKIDEHVSDSRRLGEGMREKIQERIKKFTEI